MNIIIDADNNAVTISQKFSCDLKIIWNAFTTCALLDQWWAPKPWQAISKEMNFTEGGSWTYSLISPEGDVYPARIDYQEIDEFKSIKAMDVFTNEEGEVDSDMPISKWNLSFEILGNSTLVVEKIIFEDAYHLNATLDMGFEQGIKQSIRSLESLLLAGHTVDNSKIE